MAEEQLTLVDGMSPSLRRIYQEAERLNKRMLTLRSSIQALEKPMSMSHLRRELKQVEQQAKQTSSALKLAVRTGERQGILSWNARYGGIQHHTAYGQKQYIKDADLIRYGQYIQNAQIRRNRLLYEQGRFVNGLSFDERYARVMANKQVPLSRIFTQTGEHFNKLNQYLGRANSVTLPFTDRLALAVTGLVNLAQTVGMVVDSFSRFTKSMDSLVANQGRMALTNVTGRPTRELTKELFDVANRTRGDVNATNTLYNRVATSGVKFSHQEIKDFVELFGKTMVIGGAEAQEYRAVALQIAQGISSNRLGGDELRSILEAAPIFKLLLAKAAGIQPGEVKKAGAEGKLDADTIVRGTVRAAREGTFDINKMFENMPWTFGQALQVVKNKWLEILSENFKAYHYIVNFIRRIYNWMGSDQGSRILAKTFEVLNYLIVKTLMMIEKLYRFIQANSSTIKWWAQHWKLLAGILVSVWAASNLLRTGLSLTFAILSGGPVVIETVTAAFGGLSMAVKGVGIAALGIMKPLLAVLAIIGAVVGSVMAFRHLWQEFTPENIQNQRNRKQYEYELDNYLKQRQGVMPTYMSSPGSKIKKSQEDLDREAEYQRKVAENQKIKEYTMQQYDEMAKKGIYLQHFKPDDAASSEYDKITKQLSNNFANLDSQMDKYAGTLGALSSDPKNINKVNEVGRINEDVSLNTDSIQMMKAIAERQWIMQNEVTVPAKVEVAVDRSVVNDPESIAENIVEGVKVAIASSMRGEAIA